MRTKYNRQKLVRQAVTWLVNWNYKVFLQSVNDPHPDDRLSESQIDRTYHALADCGKISCASSYTIRDKADAQAALENIISDWRHGRYGGSSEVRQMDNYYVLLSDKGFTRLFNEVTRKAKKRLEIKTDAYWARKYLAEREAG